jgi:predicted DNA-binding ribbon-helix-helix protein
MLDNDRGHVVVKSLTAKPDENCAAQVATAPGPAPVRTEESGVPLKSRVIKRSIVIGGHRTSVSLEDAFWDGLKDIARTREAHISDIVCAIDGERQYCNLSSAVRLFVFSHFHK